MRFFPLVAQYVHPIVITVAIVPATAVAATAIVREEFYACAPNHGLTPNAVLTIEDVWGLTPRYLNNAVHLRQLPAPESRPDGLIPQRNPHARRVAPILLIVDVRCVILAMC